MKIKIWSLKQGYKPTESSDSAHDFVCSDLIKTRVSELEVGADGQAHNILVPRFMIGVWYHC